MLKVDMWEGLWSVLGKVPASTLESLSNTINALTAFESSQFISDSSSCISFAEMNWFPSVSGNESLLFPFPNRRNGFFHSLPAPEFLSQFFTSFPFPTFGNVFFPCLFCSQTLKWNFPFPFPFAKKSIPLIPAGVCCLSFVFLVPTYAFRGLPHILDASNGSMEVVVRDILSLYLHWYWCLYLVLLCPCSCLFLSAPIYRGGKQ